MPLHLQGSALPGVSLIVSGACKSTFSTPCGRSCVTDLHLPPSLIGIESLLANEPAHASVYTTMESIRISVQSAELREFGRRDPSAFGSIISYLGKRTTQYERRYTTLLTEPAENRLMALLESLQHWASGAPKSGSRHVDIGLRHWEVAEMLGITPSYLSRLLKLLEARGDIGRSKGWVSLKTGTVAIHL